MEHKLQNGVRISRQVISLKCTISIMASISAFQADGVGSNPIWCLKTHTAKCLKIARIVQRLVHKHSKFESLVRIQFFAPLSLVKKVIIILNINLDKISAISITLIKKLYRALGRIFSCRYYRRRKVYFIQILEINNSDSDVNIFLSRNHYQSLSIKSAECSGLFRR